MELWTLQDPAVYEQLCKQGLYMADQNLVMFQERKDGPLDFGVIAYKWMISKMDEMIGKRPNGATHPIWAWYKQQDREDGKPDMRRSAHGEKGSPLVRMRIEVPDELVLLSDFDDWHCALNYWYLAPTKEADDIFETKWKRLGLEFPQLNDFDIQSEDVNALRREIESSWDYMFDVFNHRDEEWHFPWIKRSIQATFWRLEFDQVKSVEHFIAR